MQLAGLTIHALHDKLVSGEVSAMALTEAVLTRLTAVEERVHAYITVTPELARQQAAAADEALARGEIHSPLQGIPLAIKDNICTQGVRTTCASRILANFTPPYDATVIQRLRSAGAVFVGKANMDEFAMGSSTENSAFGPTRNPWGDLSYVPGGSSGGPAAAVAADACIAALGSDTGGSIRLPAAMTGVVGLKPTYGRVSRFGLVAFASSLDQIGPLTKDVRDAALLLQVIAGHDAHDSTSGNVPVPDYSQELERGIGGIKLGVAREDGVRYGVRTTPATHLLDMYRHTRAEGFGAEVKRRIMLGTYALSAGYYDAYYGQAQKVRTLVRREFETAFARVDLLAAPTTPGVAFRHGEKADPLAMYMNDVYTIPASMTGLPAISIPCGFNASGLPIGLQLIGRPLDEPTLLRAAHAYER